MSTRQTRTFVPSIECCCAGEPREMGVTQGQVLKTKISQLHEALRSLDAFRLEQPWWAPYPLFRWLAETKVARALVPALKQAHPDMLARLEGISAGSGVPLRSLCLINAMEAFLGSVRGRTVPASPGACSAVGVRGSWSKNGHPIVAHNFDYIPLVQPFFILRESRPKNGFRSLEFAVASQSGTIDGLNEKGLCITLNYSFAIDEDRPAPLVTMAIADALAHCITAAEAVDRIRAQPRWGGGMLMLTDASGDLLSLELSNTRSAIRRPATGQHWLVFTNVCRCAETRAVQVPEADVFGDRVPVPLRGRPVLDWHARRESRIEELVRSRGSLGENELAGVMADHGPANAPDGATPCVHTDYWRTTAALQWFPVQRRLRVAFTTACTADYIDFAL